MQEQCGKCVNGERPALSIHGKRMAGKTPCPYCRGTGVRVVSIPITPAPKLKK